MKNPPLRGALAGTQLLRAPFAASAERGALPPVDLRAVCLVRAIVNCETGTRTDTQLNSFSACIKRASRKYDLNLLNYAFVKVAV